MTKSGFIELRYGYLCHDGHVMKVQATDETPLEAAPRRTLGTVFWTVFGTIVLIMSTIVLGFLTSILSWLPPRGRIFNAFARLWSRIWLSSSRVDVRASFEKPLDPGQGYVFMANHQSWYDIPALLVSLPGQTRFMAKKGLFQIPFLGWALRAGGFIPVDRHNRTSARESFASAVQSLRGGASVLLFPEETRSPDGQMLPFKKGGFLLALRCGFPIVPIGIAGTREIRPKGSAWIQPGKVSVRYGTPIDIRGFHLADRGALMADVRDQISRLSQPPGG